MSPLEGGQAPQVTVYIPCHNYGRYLRQAVESVLEQSFLRWELILIDDGARDETAQIAQGFASLYPRRIRVFRNKTAKGLRYCANLAISEARGTYVMRLDADDYLDENALLVLSGYLDSHPEAALVYPNYIYVDEAGNVLGVESRKKIGKEAQLLDLPAHGACTMIRKRVLKSIGGYDDDYAAQDGHELWLKVLHRYQVGNVTTPLFSYRQHPESMSTDEDRLLSARRLIKRGLAKRHDGKVGPRVVAVVPAKNTYKGKELADIVLKPFVGRPLIDYTLESARKAGIFEAVFVTTDDPRVVRHCRRFDGVIAAERSKDLSKPRVSVASVLDDAVARLEKDFQVFPDIIVLLGVHCPLRRAEHIREAVDTLLLYNLDNVVSVYEDRDLHFTHGESGLQLINKGMLHRLRLEREALYVENGAIDALWRDVVTPQDLYGRKVGHIVMSLEDSFQLRSPFERRVVADTLARRKAEDRRGRCSLRRK